MSVPASSIACLLGAFASLDLPTDQFQTALKELEAHQAANISSGRLRPGNEPEIRHHGRKTKDVVVLFHGLTDSPYFMREIGARFFKLGFNVVIPILPAHGLMKPAPDMNRVTLQQWQDEVDANIRFARGLGNRVSIGGLSTGGALSLHKAVVDRADISGGVFLFSAALDINPLDQWVLRHNVASELLCFADRKRGFRDEIAGQIGRLIKLQEDPPAHYGIGENPYRYSAMFMNGARELVKLIGVIDAEGYEELSQPIFIAHSADDDTAMYSALVLLHKAVPRSTLYTLHKVPHASVVLKDPVCEIGTNKPILDEESRPIEPGNPEFEDMIISMEQFVGVYLPQ